MECYLVIDVESDGQDVQSNSMFAVAGHIIRKSDKTVLGSFRYKIINRENSVQDEDTMEWWNSKNQKDMYQTLTSGQRVDALFACNQIKQFMVEANRLDNMELTFASDNAVYDFRFVDTYMRQFTGNNYIGYNAMDIYSYAAAMFKCGRKCAWKHIKSLKHNNMIVRSEDNVATTHDPLDDALKQAVLLIDLMRMNEGLPWIPLRFGGTGMSKRTDIENDTIWYL
jgi:hypothetical protein